MLSMRRRFHALFKRRLVSAIANGRRLGKVSAPTKNRWIAAGISCGVSGQVGTANRDRQSGPKSDRPRKSPALVSQHWHPSIGIQYLACEASRRVGLVVNYQAGCHQRIAAKGSLPRITAKESLQRIACNAFHSLIRRSPAERSRTCGISDRPHWITRTGV